MTSADILKEAPKTKASMLTKAAANGETRLLLPCLPCFPRWHYHTAQESLYLAYFY